MFGLVASVTDVRVSAVVACKNMYGMIREKLSIRERTQLRSNESTIINK